MAEPILDIFALFGPIPPSTAPPGTDALRVAYQKHGVAGAVALSTRGIYYSASGGNRETAKLCAESGGMLLPAAVLDPRNPRPDPSQQGARMLALFPTSQQWPVRNAALAAQLSGGDIAPRPLLFEASRPGDATDLAGILSQSGYGAPVVLIGLEEGTFAEAVAVAKAHASVSLATDGLLGLGQIALAVELLGADKVVFGSGAVARHSLTAALATLKAAELSPEDRKKLLSENARRILAMGGDA